MKTFIVILIGNKSEREITIKSTNEQNCASYVIELMRTQCFKKFKIQEIA